MSYSVEDLRQIIARLRAPDGCPWDREQTAASLRPSLIEEAYEVVDAIEREHPADLEEELGDLLINILMQAQIASEQESFTFDSIAGAAAEKLVRRHPHVFGETSVNSSSEVLTQWEAIKRAERAAKGLGDDRDESLLDGVARAFPALVRAQKIQKKAAKARFDWECAADVLEKIREEVLEVEAELEVGSWKLGAGGKESAPGLHPSPQLPASNQEKVTEEIGDLLFAVVNLSRFLALDAEAALHAATDKFSRRFRAMEQDVSLGSVFADLSLDEMNALWETAKGREKSKGRDL